MLPSETTNVSQSTYTHTFKYQPYSNYYLAVTLFFSFCRLVATVPMEVSPPSTSESFAGLTRSGVWFEDGNVILIAAGSAAFKVHRGQLERHSEVFRDMFSIPQPKGQVLLDGCLFVELHDCPSHVFHLMTALYDGLHVFLLTCVTYECLS